MNIRHGNFTLDHPLPLKANSAYLHGLIARTDGNSLSTIDIQCMLTTTVICASSGIRFTLTNGLLLVATGSYRLAVCMRP